MPICPGFCWDSVKFLPSSLYSVVFWIQEENADNTPFFFFQLALLGTDPQSRTFQFPLPCQEEVLQKLGGSRARTDELNWPKGYSLLQSIVSSI